MSYKVLLFNHMWKTWHFIFLPDCKLILYWYRLLIQMFQSFSVNGYYQWHFALSLVSVRRREWQSETGRGMGGAREEGEWAKFPNTNQNWI